MKRTILVGILVGSLSIVVGEMVLARYRAATEKTPYQLQEKFVVRSVMPLMASVDEMRLLQVRPRAVPGQMVQAYLPKGAEVRVLDESVFLSHPKKSDVVLIFRDLDGIYRYIRCSRRGEENFGVRVRPEKADPLLQDLLDTWK